MQAGRNTYIIHTYMQAVRQAGMHTHTHTDIYIRTSEQYMTYIHINIHMQNTHTGRQAHWLTGWQPNQYRQAGSHTYIHAYIEAGGHTHIHAVTHTQRQRDAGIHTYICAHTHTYN